MVPHRPASSNELYLNALRTNNKQLGGTVNGVETRVADLPVSPSAHKVGQQEANIICLSLRPKWIYILLRLTSFY